eukprot:CAMPEP_0197936088 /NCGR_PEP_ID=MMETSP1439-20131203/114375_1 /TAXON_ID=66791 /ORGANISM="Gonyaulax spinifera, Strain CCMP409" /LENGTH=214 /DNA_ID=CAMNT_0043559049 /DNA_START=106 /DNA_END=747 /DNA_ORIENTATION=-
MGWDYWMRVAFRREGKECIMPEVPRSHHASTGGASITKEPQLKMFRLMAMAKIPNACSTSGPCQQFGDVSYLIDDVYEGWIRRAVQQAQLVNSGELKQRKLDPSKLYVLPYKDEDFRVTSKLTGLRPDGTQNAIPADVRAEHYGFLLAQQRDTRARILLVDIRGPRGYLPNQQLKLSDQCTPVAGLRGESCADACKSRGLKCDPMQMHFMNNCP